MSQVQQSGTRWLTYRWRLRWYRKKGVIIVLIWSLAAFSLAHFILKSFLLSGADQCLERNSLIVVLVTTIPLLGMLADINFGRYRVIRVRLILVDLQF